MSHDRGWRAACVVTIKIPKFHFDVRKEARGVTAMVVGSGALLGLFFIRGNWLRIVPRIRNESLATLLIGWLLLRCAPIIEKISRDENLHEVA